MHDATNAMFNSVSAPPGLEPPGSEDRRIHHGSGLAPSGSAGAVRWPTSTSLAPSGSADVLGKTDGPLLYEALFSSGLKPCRFMPDCSTKRALLESASGYLNNYLLESWP